MRMGKVHATRGVWSIGKDGDVWGRGRRESFFGMSVDNEALMMVSAGPRAVVPWVWVMLLFLCVGLDRCWLTCRGCVISIGQ